MPEQPDRSKLPPPMPQDPNYDRPPRREPGQVAGFQVVTEVHPLERQLKMGHVTGFTIRCDEATRTGGQGGDETAPSPLGYFTTAVGF
jgi:hypothetical protein